MVGSINAFKVEPLWFKTLYIEVPTGHEQVLLKMLTRIPLA